MEMQFEESCNDMGHILWPNIVNDLNKIIMLSCHLKLLFSCILIHLRTYLKVFAIRVYSTTLTEFTPFRGNFGQFLFPKNIFSQMVYSSKRMSNLQYVVSIELYLFMILFHFNSQPISVY